ncbi:aspartate aminotransferase family protein [uncultured Roseivirga sp.]|uniref:aspartate aminotransferase family protein n=1 Tax=uncultured Roseivirga sp. TaxID=543088 RepID=UPI000D795F92|nr:aspartate aminotransferase family protein [uncultured Roseivirga sp.]PWL28491.1 MAG: aspartate aminotransferase family protein [Roseivirga sp. XM-24bin3]
MDSKDVFIKHVAQTSPFPLKIEVKKAEGTYIFDKEGKKYFDLISGIAVTNIGHRHPKVVAAIKEQVDKYLHVMAYGEFVQDSQNGLAKELAKLLPSTLDCCYFVNSGTEAIEGALKLAKRVTERTEIISCHKSYHGSTHGSLSVSGNETKKYRYRPLLPDVKFMHFNKLEDLELVTEKTAAVLVEPIQGDAGVRIGSQEFLEALRHKCTKTGAQLIFDEIQTGIGRTGKMFAFEHYGVVPDILALAKGLGGGMPIGSFISSHEKMNLFTHDPILGHITTFGGHPVVCASAWANLKAIQEENMLKHVEQKGQLLEETIAHPAVKEIRRKGLMLAVEFENADLVQKIVHACLDKGIITFWFLSCPESFRLAPPINISDEDILEAGKRIKETIMASC